MTLNPLNTYVANKARYNFWGSRAARHQKRLEACKTHQMASALDLCRIDDKRFLNSISPHEMKEVKATLERVEDGQKKRDEQVKETVKKSRTKQTAAAAA